MSARRPTHFVSLFSCLAIGTALSLAAPAQAQSSVTAPVEVEIDHSARESVNNPDILQFLDRQFKVPGSSYQVRNVNQGLAGGSVSASRPYYVFPLEAAVGQTQPLIGATLTFKHPEKSYFGENGKEALDTTETMTFYSVDSVTVDQLDALPGLAGPSPAQSDVDLAKSIFNDLGDGTVYGTLTASSAQNDTFQTVWLYENAVKDLREAINSGKEDFVIGGALSSGRKPGNGSPRGVLERIFRSSDSSSGTVQPPIKLTLIFGQNLPEVKPAPVLGGWGLGLMGAGLGLLGWRRRKS